MDQPASLEATQEGEFLAHQEDLARQRAAQQLEKFFAGKSLGSPKLHADSDLDSASSSIPETAMQPPLGSRYPWLDSLFWRWQQFGYEKSWVSDRVIEQLKESRNPDLMVLLETARRLGYKRKWAVQIAQDIEAELYALEEAEQEIQEEVGLWSEADEQEQRRQWEVNLSSVE